METLKNLTLMQWIGITIGLNSLFMGATPQLTVLFGANAVPYIVAIATLGNGALGVFVTVIGGLGTQARNVVAAGGSIAVWPNAKPPLATLAMDPADNKIDAAPGAAAAVAAIAKAAAIVLFALLIVGSAAPAHAAPLPKSRPAAASTDPLQQAMDALSAKNAEIISNVIAAINEADADAAALTNASDPTSFRDPIAHACYPAQVKFLQSLPQLQAIKATVPYNLIVLFQRKRDLVAQIKAGLPPYLKVGCAALLGDEAQIFAQTLGLAGVTVAAGALTGIFPAVAPLALPALALPFS